MKFRIFPPKLFVIFIIHIVVLYLLSPGKKIIKPPYHYSGIILIIFGLGLTLWAYYLFKKDKTTVKPYENPAKLVTQGPFLASRNPMYLGLSMVLVGLTIFLGSLLTFVFPISFIIIMDVFFIRFEEQNLERIFCKSYLDYKQKVRRWL
jgi:protein-S-isoprenylcysteine O-methyltransferase Ste14